MNPVRKRNLNAWRLCRYTGVCQSGAVRRSRRRHPFRPVLAWRDVLGDGDWPCDVQGLPAEVMYQHQHARLPVEQLKDVPEPVVVLLEALLEKDPARRFQNPTELLKAMPTVTDAIDTGRRITRESLQKMPSVASRVRTRKPPSQLAPDKISIARLPVT